MRFNYLPKKYNNGRVSKKVYRQVDDDIKLIIPGELSTMNEIIDIAKTHWTQYKQMKETNDELVAWYAQQQQIPFYKAAKLKITYYRTDKSYDPDNIVAAKKFILDGLVQAGVLENDGWKQIRGFEENWEVDKDNPRIEVEFEGVN